MLQKREGAVRWARGKEARTWTSGHHRCGESPRSRPQGRTSTNAEAGDSDTLMRSHGFPEPTIDEHESIALVDALREQAGIIARATNTTASRAALAASQWSDHAPRRAALIEGGDRESPSEHHPTVARMGERRALGKARVRGRLRTRRGQTIRSRGCAEGLPRRGEALAAKHIERRDREHVPVLNQMAKLTASLGDDPTRWAVPVGRLAALATLPDETWARLEHAPAWAVSYALGETVTDEEAYRRDVETLAAHLGQWAGPHALRAAQSEIIHIDGPNPDRLGTLLRTWPCPCRSTTGSRRHARTLRLHKPRDRTMGSSLDAQARPQNEGTGGRRGIDRPDPAQRRSIVRAAYCGRFVSCTSLR